MIYLDWAATAPLSETAKRAWLEATAVTGNASATHAAGRAARSVLEDAREQIASVLGVDPPEVVFTSGGTEADNLAIKGIAIAAVLQHGKRHLIPTPIEHEAVLESAAYLTRVHGFEVTLLPVDGFGRVDIDAAAAALRDDTALVSVGYANNEIGTVQDIAALAALARARGIPFHTDAVQAAGWLPISAAELGVDALSIAGHKFGAPKGTGVLAVRGRVPVEPLLHGGGQERDRRSGTENVAGAVALATALTLAEAERPEAAVRVAALRDRFIESVLQKVPSSVLTGHPTHRLPATASFTFAGTSGEAVLLELERRGIVSSSGSACAAGSDEASHVLLAIGVPTEVAQTSVRFTLPHDLDAPLDDVAEAVAASVAALTR